MTTIWADWCFLFLIGMLFGYFNARQIAATGSLFFNRYYLFALLFQTLFCMPLAIYCYLVFPDWCWMYVIKAERVPRMWVVLAFLGYYAVMTLGFGLSAWKERTTYGAGRRLLDLSLVACAILFFIFYRRLLFVGTFEEFHAGTAPFIILRQPLFLLLFLGINLAIGMLILFLAYLGKDLDYQWTEEDRARFERRRRVVSITPIGDDVKEALKQSLQQWNGVQYLKELLWEKSRRVLLKPNLAGGGKDRAGTQTSAEIIGDTIDLLRELREDAEIIVVESPSIFWWSLEKCYEGSKVEQVLKEKQVRFIDLQHEPLVLHDVGGRIGTDLFPTVLFEPHILIDLPVVKTHAFFRMSCAVKNLFGLVPTALKFLRYHTKGFADAEGQIFLDLYRTFTPDLVIVDGIVSCEGEGPFGSPKQTNVLITSDDAICADVVVAEIMGYSIEDVPYLRAFERSAFKPTYELVGVPVAAIKPPVWKRPSNKLWSLLINLWSMKVHQRRLKSRHKKRSASAATGHTAHRS